MTAIPTPKLATADVCDAKGDAVSVLPIQFSSYGGRADFAGPAMTVKTLDDNSLLKSLLKTPGEGRVIVVDGGGSRRAALLGGNLAADAASNGWAGLVIHGCVRDLHEICEEDIGIMALGTCPRKSVKQDRGATGVDISIGDVLIKSGYWIIADSDGIVVSPELPSL